MHACDDEQERREVGKSIKEPSTAKHLGHKVRDQREEQNRVSMMMLK